jgi:pseudouridine kinase
VHEHVVVVGGANVDIKGRIAGEHRGATSHPGLIWRTVGGVGRNIATNLSAMQCAVQFITPIGTDDDGELVLSELLQSGVDVHHVFRATTHPTGRYLAVFDAAGELEVAVSDMGIMEVLSPAEILKRSEVFQQAKVICVDANLPPETIGATLDLANSFGIISVVQTVSVQKSLRILKYLPYIHTITPNREELSALTDMPTTTIEEVERAAKAIQSRGVHSVVVTMGGDGVLVASHEGTEHFPTTYVPVIDATGAGDAFTAGLVCGYCRNMSMSNMIRLGQSLASQILKSTESVLKGSFT